MKAQVILSHFSVPHRFIVFDLYGSKLFEIDPVQDVVIHKKNGMRTHVELRSIQEKKFIRSVDGKILFEYDPMEFLIVHKTARICTEINMIELKKLYSEIKTETEQYHYPD